MVNFANNAKLVLNLDLLLCHNSNFLGRIKGFKPPHRLPWSGLLVTVIVMQSQSYARLFRISLWIPGWLQLFWWASLDTITYVGQLPCPALHWTVAGCAGIAPAKITQQTKWVTKTRWTASEPSQKKTFQRHSEWWRPAISVAGRPVQCFTGVICRATLWIPW